MKSNIFTDKENNHSSLANQ